MQTTSSLYKTLRANSRTRLQTVLSIGGKVYTESRVISLKTSGGLYAKNIPAVGGTVSREIDFSFLPRAEEIPRMAEIKISTNLVLDDQVSEPLPKGDFYIDTRYLDETTGTLVVHGYDAMLKAEEQYIYPDSESTTWPRKMPVVVADICSRMGVTLDERTVINDWDVPYPGDLTMREILGYIAGCHGGNWTITDAGMLRLVPLVPSGKAADIGNAATSLSVSPTFDAFANVVFYYDDKITFRAPVDEVEGRTLEIVNPWATQEIADSVLTAIHGYVYQPYEVKDAVLDPAMELGDLVTVGDTTGPLAVINTTFDALCTADISAPAEQEIDHEYPYPNKQMVQTRREVAKAAATLKVGINEIEAKVSKQGESITSIKQTVESITLEVTSDKDGTSSAFKLKAGDAVLSSGNITFNGYVTFKGLEEGTTVIDGGCIQTGTILANLIKAGVLQSKDGKTFNLDLDNGTFSMQASGQFISPDGKTAISVEDNTLVLYERDHENDGWLDKIRIGFMRGPSPDGTIEAEYPYMLFGNAGALQVGLLKKFWNGFWLGNSAPAALNGNFNGVDGASGIFVNTETGKTYVVDGTNMQNVYTGAAIAKFR